MRTFIIIISTLILVLLEFTGCKIRNKDYVFEEFKSRIENKGMRIDSVDKTGLVYISQGDNNLKVSLDNVRKNYARDKDTSNISALVESIVSYSLEIPSNWKNAKDSIYISFFPNDYKFESFLHHKVTDEFSKVYVYSGNEKLTWITQDDLKKWNITENELDNQAKINADKLWASTKITFDTIENRRLGLIETEHETLKGALLFSPVLKQKVLKDFGFPFYAVLPVRDFCYIFSEQDFKFFSKRIGSVVIDEYKHSGYPITPEILKFNDKGVEAVGKYPVQ